MSLFDLQRRYRDGILPKAEYIAAMAEIHAVLFEYAAFMPDTDVTEIAIADGKVVFTIKGTCSDLRMTGDPTDRRMAPLEILNFGAYESSEFQMILRLLDDGQTILDIGANIGWYSLQIAAAFPNSRVYAFEPIPKTFSFLERNLGLNRIANVFIHNIGFWHKADTLTFFFYPEGSGNASAANVSDNASAIKIDCQVNRLDDFVAEHGLRVDFIKCDVEGAELQVFEGSLDTLRRDSPILFTEMLRKWSAKFGYHPNQLIHLLAGVGYRCYTVCGDTLREFSYMNDMTEETNFFFLHPRQHAEKIRVVARP